jgi:hypothetical protein
MKSVLMVVAFVLACIGFGLLIGYRGHGWWTFFEVPSGSKCGKKPIIALICRLTAFSCFAGFCFPALKLIAEIVIEVTPNVNDLSWFIKIPILIFIGLYLANYSTRFEKNNKDKIAIKVMVLWGTDEDGKPNVVLTKEIMPINGEKFTVDELESFQRNLDIIRRLV